MLTKRVAIIVLVSSFCLLQTSMGRSVEGDQPVAEAPPPAAEPAPAAEPKAKEAPSAAPALVADQYEAVYRTGNAPLPEKTKVTITKTPEGLTIMPQKKGGEGWTIPIKSIRGAQASTGGLWLFWFNETDNTLTGHFKMEKGQDILAADINSAVNQYHQAAFEAYKVRFEQYKTEALKESQ